MSEQSMRTDALSLLDFPQTVLEDIVTYVRRAILYDGYLCELRLVSRRLNEAVLHCLGFEDSPRDFFPWHYLSCPTEKLSCHKPSCNFVSRSNHMYSRYQLQANIHLSRAKAPRLTGFYESLAQALDLYREHLKQPGGLFASAKLQVNNTNLFRCASSNPIFVDGPGIVFSEATLTLMKTVTGSWQIQDFAKHHLCHRSAWFWLRNLACFLGDIDLFDFYSSPTYSGDTAPAALLTELPELLITTAARSHSVLSQHILCRIPPSQSTDLRFALQAACCSGSLEITKMILQACPAGTVPTMCAQSLYGRQGSRRVSPNYLAAAEEVVNRCGEIPRLDLCMILWTQAEMGASSVVRLLLERYRNRTFWPHNPITPIASFSALWSACVNNDIECVRTLIRHDYFAKMKKDDIRGLCLECMYAAVHANAFSICQELCKFLGIELCSVSLGDLASVDGSLEAIIQKLEINPDELDAKTCKSEKHTFGQLALSRAARLLRVENVRFLLEKGVRLHKPCLFEPFMIEWRRKRANEQKFHEVQKLLQQYGLSQLQVEL